MECKECFEPLVERVATIGAVRSASGEDFFEDVLAEVVPLFRGVACGFPCLGRQLRPIHNDNFLRSPRHPFPDAILFEDMVEGVVQRHFVGLRHPSIDASGEVGGILPLPGGRLLLRVLPHRLEYLLCGFDELEPRPEVSHFDQEAREDLFSGGRVVETSRTDTCKSEPCNAQAGELGAADVVRRSRAATHQLRLTFRFVGERGGLAVPGSRLADFSVQVLVVVPGGDRHTSVSVRPIVVSSCEAGQPRQTVRRRSGHSCAAVDDAALVGL